MRNQWARSLNDFPRGTGWRRSLHGSFVFAILYDRQLCTMEWLQSPQQENEDIPNCPWRVTKWRKRNCKTLWKRRFPKRNWASSTSSSGEQTQSVRSRNRALNISKLNPEMINGSLCVVVCTLPATGKPSYNFAKVLPHCSPYHSLVSSCLWSFRNGTWPLPDWREVLDGQRQNYSAKMSKSSTLQRPIDKIVLLEGTAEVTLY